MNFAAKGRRERKEISRVQLVWLAWLCMASAWNIQAAPLPVSFELSGTMQIESRWGATNEAKFSVKVLGREWQIQTEEGKERHLEMQHFDGTNLFHVVDFGSDVGGSVAEADHLRFGGSNIRILWFAFCSEAVLKRTNWIRAPWFMQHRLPGELSYSMTVESKLSGSDLPQNVSFSTSTERWLRESAMWKGKAEFSHPQFLREFSPTNFPEGVVHARYQVVGERALDSVRLPEAFEFVIYMRPGGEAKGDMTASFSAKVETILPLADTNLSLSGIRLGVLNDYRFADNAMSNLVIRVARPKGWMTKNDPDLLAYVAKERSRLERQDLAKTFKRIWPALVGPLVALMAIAAWLLLQRRKERRSE